MQISNLIKSFIVKVLGFVNLKSAQLLGLNSADPSIYSLKNLETSKNTKMVVIDVGANIGDFSALCEKAFSKLEVVFIEPQPELLHTLQLTFGESHRYFPVAVSDRAGTGILSRRTVGDRKAHFSEYRDSNSLEVEITTIDILLKKEQIQEVDLLKIDAEGADFQVMKGAVDSIKSGKIKRILFEINFRTFLGGNTPSVIEHWLRDEGFSHFYRSSKWFGFIPLRSLQNFRAETQNILALTQPLKSKHHT